MTLICLVYGFLFPFTAVSPFREYAIFLPVVFVVALCIGFILQFQKVMISDISMAFLFTTIISFAFTSVILIRFQFGKYAMLYVLIALMGSWITDSGAMLTGRYFGKHKLCPSISPKKTVEGAVGGVVTSVVVFAIFSTVYNLVSTDGSSLSIVGMMVIGFFCAILSMVGDLTASVVKRQCGVKDFGNIMPGHGGVLDRFDSVLVVAPFVYLVALYFGIIIL